MIGELVDLLHARRLWESTLVVFTSDNGGSIYIPAGANNYPLLGGKYSDWEGGVRTAAFVSGGALPPERRGNSTDAIISIADWCAPLRAQLPTGATQSATPNATPSATPSAERRATRRYATLCSLAGADPHDAEGTASGLPPVDSLDQWPAIAGTFAGVGGRNPRVELHLSAEALLDGADGPLWKLIVGWVPLDFRQGPSFPNATSQGPSFFDLDCVRHPHIGRSQLCRDCGAGCLFDVLADPEERVDLATLFPQVPLSLRRAPPLLNLSSASLPPAHAPCPGPGPARPVPSAAISAPDPLRSWLG